MKNKFKTTLGFPHYLIEDIRSSMDARSKKQLEIERDFRKSQLESQIQSEVIEDLFKDQH